ncbi:MAG: tetratricopeptide repeat protein, partial [Salinivirgaceae bacterium]|nr:tetratricopeptide repeat protein [Salinivirgaceae bacterium]
THNNSYPNYRMISTSKKYYLFFVLLISFITNLTVANAQVNMQAEIDSLSQVLSKSKEFEQKKVLLKALSNCYQNQGDWEGYEKVVQQMLLLQNEKTDSFYLAETYNKLGISNCCLGKNNEALDYFGKALEINLAMNMENIAANSYENLGIVHKDMGNYLQAANCQFKSLELRKGTNSPRIFNNYMKLSIIHELLDDTAKMDYYVNVAKSEMSKRDSVTPRNKTLFYNQLGEIYSNRGDNDSSIVCYRNVIRYATQICWSQGIAEGLGNIADIFYGEGQLDSAIVYHKKSLKLSQEISNSLSIAKEYLALAKLYNETGRYDSAMFFSNNSLQICNESDLLKEKSDALKFISQFYNSQNKYKQAYSYLQLHYAINDSIASSDVKNNVAELETKYETKVKEQRIELLTAENKLKNRGMWLFAAASVILLLSFVFGIFLFIRRKKENLQRQETLEQQLLRSQMNPHFLFNALGSIQNFMLKNETKRAAGYLNNFASLTRNILEHSDKEFVSVSDEIETLKSYMELEKMRLQNNFEFEIIYDKDLEIDFINIPPMLIQPFVENAIKHGLNDIDYMGLLELKFEDKGTALHIEIMDNGVGFGNKKSDKLKKHRSMSMGIFEQRRIVLAKRTKQAIGLEIENRGNIDSKQTGTLIKMKIPIIT